MSYVDFVRRTATVVVIVAVTVLSIVILWNIRSFLLVAFTGWVLSVALDMPIARLQEMGLRRGYAILITMAGTFFVIGLLITLILPPILGETANLVDDLPQLAEDSVMRYEEFYNDNDSLQRFLPEFTLDDYEALFEAEDDPTPTDDNKTEPMLEIGSVFSSAVPILGGIGSLLGDIVANLFLVFFLTLYFVLDPLPYYKGLLAIVPKEREARLLELINEVRRIVTVWLGALVVSITAQALMVIFVLGVVLRVPNALALGLIAGISNIIPNIGFYLALIPVVIVTLSDDPRKVIPAIILYVIAGETEGKLISPKVVESGLSLPAGLVLVFQLIAGVYLGFFGILLAVPILAIIVAMIRELYVRDTLAKDGVPELEELADGKLVFATDADSKS